MHTEYTYKQTKDGIIQDASQATDCALMMCVRKQA